MAAAAKKRQQTPVQAQPVQLTAGSIGLVVLSLLALVSQAGASTQAAGVDAAAIVLGVAGVLAAVMVVARPMGGAPDRLTYAWSAFMAWMLVATVTSGRTWSALMGEVNYLAGFAALAALTLVALGASSRVVELRRLLVVIAPWVLVAQVAVVAIQLAVGATPNGSMPNTTYLGEIVLLLLPWVLAHDAPASLPRPARFGIAVACVVALAASGSRVAVVVALVWLAVEGIGRLSIARGARLWATVAVVAAVVVAGFLFARAEILGSASIETLGERPQMWAVAVRAVAQSPLIGYGPDGFIAAASVATPQLAQAGDAITFRPGAADPHSLVVWLVLAGGFIGLALIAWVGVELVLRWIASRRDGVDVAPAIWALAGALVVYLTAPAAIQTWPMFAVVAGVSIAVPGRLSPREGLAWYPTALRVVSGLLGLVCAVYVLNAAVRYPLEESGPEVSPAKAASARQTAALWSWDPHLAYLASLHLGYAASVDPAIAAERPDLSAIRTATALDRYNPFYALEYARTLKYYDRPAAEVEKAFLGAFERYPAYPLARAEYAAFLAEQGRFDEAAEQIDIAELVPDQDESRIGAIQAARRLIEASPR